MNQSVADEVQTHPSFPLLFGIDGRHVGSLRRFRGFKRLDYDIREASRSSELSFPVFNLMAGYAGDALLGNRPAGALAIRFFGPHDWDADSDYDAVSSIDPENLQFYGMWAVTLSRSGRTDKDSDRRPISGFILYFKGPNSGRPVLKFMGRSVGDSTREALFQVVLVGGATTILSPIGTATSNWLKGPGIPQILDRFFDAPTGSGETFELDWPGIAAVGRMLFVSHTKRSADLGDVRDIQTSDYFQPGGKTWVFTCPQKAYIIRDPSQTLPVLPFDEAFYHTYTGYLWPGDRHLACKVAGSEHWKFFHTTAGNSDNSLKDVGASTADASHETNSKLRVRVRFVNKTTGFVSPMSEPLALTLTNGKKRNISWATAEDTVSNDARQSIKALWGSQGNVSPGVFALGQNVLQLYNVVVQIWCTQTVSEDNPGDGGPFFFLDQEIPVYTAYAAGQYLRPHETKDSPETHVPSKNNDELFQAEVYDERSDAVVGIQPNEAMIGLDGVLLSLSSGDDEDLTAGNVGKGDIRTSPPWKQDNAGWLEAIAPLVHHGVEPRSGGIPSFVRTSSIAFLANKNKLVRCFRNGSRVIFDDVDVMGPVSHDAIAGLTTSVIIVTSSGVVEMNAVSTERRPFGFVQRIMDERWSEYLKAGRIMSGYDKQLNAVFIAPRRALDSTDWFRSEAIVIWLSTGRVTMLSDIYWVSMCPGVHPITGKEHLFFVDPAMNITYADDSQTETAGIATMTGINDSQHPDFDIEKGSWTIRIVDYTALSGVIVYVDGIPFEEGVSWDAVTSDTQTATNLKTAINDWRTSQESNTHPVYGHAVPMAIDAATSSTDTVTITARYKGPVAKALKVSSRNDADTAQVPTSAMVITQVSDGETAADHSTEKHGGVVAGAVTSKTSIAGPATRFTDNVTSLTGKGVFDRYGWYDVRATSPNEIKYRPALVGSQVYFFRTRTDDEGRSVVDLVADGRIKNNGTDNFEINDSDLNFHGTYTSVDVGDHYSIAPVVMQIVGAPFSSGISAGSNIVESVSVQNVEAYISRALGYAKEGATRYPSSSPHSSAVFIGTATPEDMEARKHGQPVSPKIHVGTFEHQGSAGNSNVLVWEEPVKRRVVVAVDKRGNSVFPVLTHYGTNYQFDVDVLDGKLSVTGGAAGTPTHGSP